MQNNIQHSNAYDPQAFLKVVRLHVQAEVAGDVDAVMATLCNEPHFEFHPLGLIVKSTEATREYYRRVLPLFPQVIPSGDSATWEDGDAFKFFGSRGIVTFDTGKLLRNGREIPFTGLSWFIPDLASGLLKGEHVFMHGATAAVVGELLGKGFADLPGVSIEN